VAYLLDTNICIYIIKKKPTEMLERLISLDPLLVNVSSITVAELEYGVAKSSRPDQNREALLNFLAPLQIITFDTVAAQHYGEIRAYLEKRGGTIGAMDLLLAAHARSRSLIMVTNNEREYSRVPGLRIENWVA